MDLFNISVYKPQPLVCSTLKLKREIQRLPEAVIGRAG